MKFILWYAVFWGLSGIHTWIKIYSVGWQKYYDDINFATFLVSVVSVAIFFWLWNNFIK